MQVCIHDRSEIPWWLSDKESACQCRRHGFNPWPGKIPDATEQLSPMCLNTESDILEPVLHSKRNNHSKKPSPCN